MFSAEHLLDLAAIDPAKTLSLHLEFDGQTTYLKARTRPVLWDGSLATEVQFIDVSREQVLESALTKAERLRGLGKLTGQVAHDFNNLWGAVSGNLELLSAKLDGDEKYARHLTSGAKAVDRGIELTRQLLSYARRANDGPETVDVAKALTDLDGLISRAAGNNVAVSLELETNLGASMIEMSQFEQAVVNLAQNAGDAMAGGGSLTIVGKLIDGDTPMINLRFTDSGDGIPAADLPHVIQPFFSTKSPDDHAGLGLSQVQAFVHSSDGALIIEPDDKGTTIILELPQYTGSSATTAEENTAGSADPSPETEPASIMIIEPDHQARSLACELLSSQKHRVHEVSDAATAFMLIETVDALDLLIIAATLPPGISGMDLLKAAQHNFPDTKVLFLTGNEDLPDHFGAIETAGLPFIQKPFYAQELEGQLRALM